MNVTRKKKIVLLGMMTKMPVAGVVWQTLHYLVGFQRLGYEPYYVEAHARAPAMFIQGEKDDGAENAARFIARIMQRFDLGARWAYHALHSDGRLYGMNQNELDALYQSAELIINLHGGTAPRPEHYANPNRLIFLETDPVALQIELQTNVAASIEFLKPHRAFFTFAENYGQPDCRLPVAREFHFHTTRQPVVMDFWQYQANDARGAVLTTIGNWQQKFRDVKFNGEMYRWSKHYEFLKFIDLPTRTAQPFELALSRFDESDRALLESNGWRVRRAMDFSNDLDAYREYITHSRGEFTVAKDQNVRLRTGWFSDRSATYLAAGRPVITQETGFSNILPTGAGLYGFSTMQEILNAVQEINRDYERQRRAAREIAHTYFDANVVLGKLLQEAGI